MATEGIARLKTVSVTKALAAAGNYDAEDVLSQSATVGTVWTFSAIATSNGRGGYITRARVICETTALTPRLTLYLFNTTPTSAVNDNVANTAVLNADIAKYEGKIDFPAMEDLGGDSEATHNPSGKWREDSWKGIPPEPDLSSRPGFLSWWWSSHARCCRRPGLPRWGRFPFRHPSRWT